MHSNGINIRYLGYLADQLKDNKKLTYFKYMLEREVVIRCVKHILNQYIRDNESSELLGAMISHIFNCLLAPKEFIKRLDDGVLKYEPVTVKSIVMIESKRQSKTPKLMPKFKKLQLLARRRN